MLDLDKQNLMLSLCKSAHINPGEKVALVDQYLGKDLSDSAIENSYQCKASYPDPKVKEEVWQKIIESKSSLSHNLRESYMRGFNQWNQFELRKPYFDKFFATVFDVYSNNSFSYFKKFFFNMLPRLNEIEDGYIAQLKS